MCIACNMAAPRQDTATLRELELEINQLLEEQVESLARPLLSITNEEAVQFAAGRNKFTALLKQLAHSKASNPAHSPDDDGTLSLAHSKNVIGGDPTC